MPQRFTIISTVGRHKYYGTWFEKGCDSVRKLCIIAFWGGLWGLTEATVGHFLHLVAFPIGWLVWFPLAFGFMGTVYQQTGQPDSVFTTALIAASIKLANLAMPVPVVYVINPSISILLEGVAVFVVFRALVKLDRPNPVGLWPLMGINLLWRALFCVYLLFLPADFVKATQLIGLMPFLQFLLFESAVNSLTIYGAFRCLPRSSTGSASFPFNPHPLVAFGILGIALLLQLKL